MALLKLERTTIICHCARNDKIIMNPINIFPDESPFTIHNSLAFVDSPSDNGYTSIRIKINQPSGQGEGLVTQFPTGGIPQKLG